MLHDDEVDWTLMARYLAGECSGSERAAVERWLDETPERRREMAEVSRWWSEAGLLPTGQRVDAMWSVLSRKMHEGDSVAVARPARMRHGHTHVMTHPAFARTTPAPHARWPLVAALAAGIAVAATATLAVRGEPGAALSSPSREFTSARGQRATIRLVDGTRVELGFASTLRVFAFEDGRRELTLDGEALFDVVHDSTRPFIVHAGNATTEDLGTTFGVRAYASDSAVRVVVVSGTVALRPRRPVAGVPEANAVLGPGELGQLHANGRLDVQRGVDTSAYFSWLSGRIAFHNQSLERIATELERMFGVTIRIPDPAVAGRRVTVDMNLPPLTELLDAVVAPLDLHHRREGGVIVIER